MTVLRVHVDRMRKDKWPKNILDYKSAGRKDTAKIISISVKVLYGINFRDKKKIKKQGKIMYMSENI
jgi:hypothetical protein